MASHGHRASRTAIAAVSLALGFGVPIFDATGDDRPVVLISKGGAVPPRLEVHVGEVVSWRAVSGGRLRLELDRHPSAHEVVERHGEVRGVFRKPGEHSYSGRLLDDGDTPFRGVVIVGAGREPLTLPPQCAPESSDRICITP